MEKPLYRACGCDKCKGTGYSGRLAILEILVVTKEIKKLIAAHAHDIEIEEVAVETPAVEEVVVAPQTFDLGVIAAIAAIVSAAGYAISKKR